MDPSELCHWLPFASPILGTDAPPQAQAALSAFLAGPENRLAETAVYWALGGLPFFADSPELQRLSQAVRSPQENAPNKGASRKKNAPENAASLFDRPSYPLAPNDPIFPPLEEETQDLPNSAVRQKSVPSPNEKTSALGRAFPPVVDYTPLVNVPYLSPLVFYGPSGSGKSHLAAGIYQEYRHRHPKERGISLSAAEFYRGLTDAMTKNQGEAYRQYFAKCRIIVLENIDYLENRPTGNEELLALLRSCEKSGTLVLLTMIPFPGDVSGFPNALKSRLIGGFLVPVAFPSRSSRHLLLKHFAEAYRLPLSAPLLEKLTDLFPQPAGEVYGLFSQMFYYFDWRKNPPDLAKIKEFLSRRPASPKIALDDIAKASAAHFAVKLSELKGKSRTKTVVLARNMTIYLARTLTPITLQELGAQLAGRDHSTILHACHDLKKKIAQDPEIEKAYQTILHKLSK